MTLSVAEMREVLSSVSYKEGWEFFVYEGKFYGPHLTIIAQVPDSYNPGHTTDLGIECVIPTLVIQSNSDFLDWLLGRLIEAEIHETREFFLFKGNPWSDPHDPLSARDRDGAERNLK